MRHSILAAASFAALLLTPVAAQPAAGGSSGLVRVKILTSEGPIVLALEARRAPKTTANFLAYVDDGRFDGTTFYRSARRRLAQKMGFIQGGIQTDARRILPPFAFESTSRTGVRHLDGTISMARRSDPKSAGGNYFITVGAIPSMDAHAGDQGYAAFGHVVSGMATVRRILAEPTGGGSDLVRQQLILHPVRVMTVRRIDGSAKPTAHVRPWLIKTGK